MPVQAEKLILQMRERYTCIRKQIDVAEHNEKIYRSLSRTIRVFHRNMTIEEGGIDPAPHYGFLFLIYY